MPLSRSLYQRVWRCEVPALYTVTGRIPVTTTVLMLARHAFIASHICRSICSANVKMFVCMFTLFSVATVKPLSLSLPPPPPPPLSVYINQNARQHGHMCQKKTVRRTRFKQETQQVCVENPHKYKHSTKANHIVSRKVVVVCECVCV